MPVCPLQLQKALVFAFKMYFLYSTLQCTPPPGPLLSRLAVGGAEAETRSLILIQCLWFCYFILFLFFKTFIYLAVPGLRCGMQDL